MSIKSIFCDIFSKSRGYIEKERNTVENKVEEIRVGQILERHLKPSVLTGRFLGSIDEENEKCANFDRPVVPEVTRGFRRVI